MNEGDMLAVLHVNDASRLEEAAQKIIQAYRITSEARPAAPLVYAIVTKDGVERFV